MKWIFNKICLSFIRNHDIGKYKLLKIGTVLILELGNSPSRSDSVKFIRFIWCTPWKPGSFTITASSYCWSQVLLKSLPFLSWWILVQREHRGVGKVEIFRYSPANQSQCPTMGLFAGLRCRTAGGKELYGKLLKAIRNKSQNPGMGKEQHSGCLSKPETPLLYSWHSVIQSLHKHHFPTQPISRLVEMLKSTFSTDLNSVSLKQKGFLVFVLSFLLLYKKFIL